MTQSVDVNALFDRLALLVTGGESSGGGSSGEGFAALSALVGVRKTADSPGTGIFSDLDELVGANFAAYERIQTLQEELDGVKEIAVMLNTGTKPIDLTNASIIKSSLASFNDPSVVFNDLNTTPWFTYITRATGVIPPLSNDCAFFEFDTLKPITAGSIEFVYKPPVDSPNEADRFPRTCRIYYAAQRDNNHMATDAPDNAHWNLAGEYRRTDLNKPTTADTLDTSFNFNNMNITARYWRVELSESFSDEDYISMTEIVFFSPPI